MSGRTIRQAILEGERSGALPSEDLAVILEALARAGTALTAEIGRAPFLGLLGYAGATNVTGDAQKKLDVAANDIVLEALDGTGLVASVISEELEAERVLSGDSKARYLVAVDPLDGSSNTDVDGALGTIFGVYRRPPSAAPRDERAALPQGSDLLAAGYILYGPSALLVFAAGGPVRGLPFRPGAGPCLLSHPDIRCPKRGSIYSATLGVQRNWPTNVRAYLDYLTEIDPATKRPYSLRYSGALVADLHRVLLQGGLYLYPPDAKRPEGKLRLLYECAPLALVTERAGGGASTGTGRILEVRATSPHQRSPLAVGSADEVALYERFVRTGAA